jgi:hypothetical protein
VVLVGKGNNMAINGNLPGQTTNSPDTTNYFNNFYDNGTNTSPMINDAVVAYFQNITGNADTGKNLAAAVIYTALQQSIDPMSVIDQLQALSKKNLSNKPTIYPGTTNQSAQDTNVYNAETGTWTSSGKQYAKPGPSATYNQISELDAYLTMFLNLNRVGTSLLGLSNSPQVSPYISRAILA